MQYFFKNVGVKTKKYKWKCIIIIRLFVIEKKIIIY